MKKKIIYPVIAIVMIVASGLGGYLIGSHKTNTVQLPAYSPTTEVKSLADTIGLSDQDLADAHVTIGQPLDPGAGCGSGTVACYLPNSSHIYLFVKAFAPGQDPATNLAYEFSHYDWTKKMTQSDRDGLKPLLDSWYTAHKSLVDQRNQTVFTAEGATPGSDLLYNELHAITCTEASDDQLNPALVAQCNSYLPHRDALKRIY